jgi:hypothetical protein
VKNSSAVSFALSPTFCSRRPRSNPGVPRSTAIRLTPCAPSSGAVLATTTTRSACSPLVMKVFCPLSMYESPSRTAVVRTPARSLPAPGSLIAIAVISSPEQKPGSHRLRCSSVVRSVR